METVLHNKEHRFFTIVKGVLICMPFFCLAYLKLGMNGGALTIGDSLAKSPQIAVMFLSSMLQPYVAFLISLAQRRMADGRQCYALANMSLLFLSEAMLMSSVGLIGVGLLTYRTCKASQVGIFQAWRSCRPGKLFSEVGGSILILLLCMVCLFATIRIGGLV